jgi:3-deoxy-D-manno-octulosonic-acid transferase
VGETISILPVVRALLDGDAALRVLMTTGTITAAGLLAREMPDALATGRLLHRFVPLDVPRWVGRFLRHWRPDCLVLTESELWPNMIAACNAGGIPVTVMNGRISRPALSGWRRAPRTARTMMEGLSWVAARSPEDAARFRMLGAAGVFCDGDLKTAAPPLAADSALLDAVRGTIGARPVWIAASTHPDEEALVLEAARHIMKTCPDLLTVIAPRHPDRGAAVAAEAERALQGHAPRRALGELPTQDCPVWIVDTLGELGTVFRLSRIVFMGNSLFPHQDTSSGGAARGGGHNPFEPARLGCVLATGPAIGNFEDAFAALARSVTIVASSGELATWVAERLDDPEETIRSGESGRAVATRDQHLPERLARLIRRTAHRD